MAEEAQYNWDSPTGMADYANKYLKNFVPEKDIKDSILTTSPVPANIQGPKKLDDLFKELLEEKKKETELFWDSNLERIQQKTLHVFGPLSKVWMTIEEANDAESTKVEIPLEDLTTSLEQSVMLLGQAINSMTYQRRCNALSAVMSDTRKIKSTVKEQAALFASNKDDNLFGKPFRKHVMDTFKAKKESSEVYKNTDGKRQPFRKGPSLHRGFGGRTAVFSKSTGSQQQPGPSQNFRQDGQQRGFRGKKKHENRTSPQHANRYTSDYCSNRTKNVHPIIKGLFPIQIIREVPLAGRLQYFVNNWQILTKNPDILELVSGLRLSFIEEPIQNKPPHQAEMNMEQSALIDKEIDAMLRKGAIQKVRSQRDQFLSNLFLVEKKEGGNRPVINLKNLNAYLPYLHFKMAGPHLLKVMLQEKDYLCKVDLKDAYFCIPLHQTARKYVRFQWKGNIYQFLCLCFGLGPAPRLFTKLLKLPIALMRRLNVRIIIYLDDMLLMCQSVEKMLLARDTLLFLLQHLGFVINQTKSQLTPVQKIEFLGMEINSLDMTLNLPQQKVNSLIKQCQVVQENPRITVWRLSSLIGTLSSTAQAVLPAQLQLRYLQQQLIESLRLNRTYQSYITLNQTSLQEIEW